MGPLVLPTSYPNDSLIPPATYTCFALARQPAGWCGAFSPRPASPAPTLCPATYTPAILAHVPGFDLLASWKPSAVTEFLLGLIALECKSQGFCPWKFDNEAVYVPGGQAGMSRCFKDAIPKHNELSPPPGPPIQTFYRSGLCLGGGW